MQPFFIKGGDFYSVMEVLVPFRRANPAFHTNGVVPPPPISHSPSTIHTIITVMKDDYANYILWVKFGTPKYKRPKSPKLI